MDFGIIGNCQYSAVIDRQASIKWLCWPRFDSPSLFGALLDDQAGSFDIIPSHSFQTEQSYIKNTNILRTVFRSPSSEFEVIDFAPRFYQNFRYYRPTLLCRVIRPIRGTPFVCVRCRPCFQYGLDLPTIHRGSNHLEYLGGTSKLRLTTNVPITYIEEERSFAITQTHHFALSWGQPLEAALEETVENFFHLTKQYWEGWVKTCAIPENYQSEVIRSALILKLHQFEDTGAIIAATTTSIPEARESQRNWDYRYCWLRDAYFTLHALKNLGQFQELENFVGFLRNIAEQENLERLQPVFGINGESQLIEKELDHLNGYQGHRPVRVGNAAYTHIQNDVYGEMLTAMTPLFLDQRLTLEGTPPPFHLVNRMLSFIESTLEQPDAGLWEFRNSSQMHTFTLLMHWMGATQAEKIGRVYDLSDLVTRAQRVITRCGQLLDQECWNTEIQAYTQAKGSKALDGSLFLMNTLGYLKPSDPKALSHVNALAQGLSDSNGFVYRYNCKDDFGKPEVSFLVCGFWYVEALAQLGNFTLARKMFNQYLKTQNHLGLLSEDFDSTDQTRWGNFPQTYSHVGVINAAFALSRPC